MSKQFVNSTSTCVRDNLLGLVRCNPHLQLLQGQDVVVARPGSSCPQSSRNRFALISGGGSGHEPCAAGLVGPGGLDAAVAGQVFASPSSFAVLQAIRLFSKKTPILLLVLNYTGDRIQFGLAQEKARLEGYRVRTLVIEDDCVSYGTSDKPADQPNQKSKVGQRGVAGVYLVYRMANALAQLCPEDQGLDWLCDQLQLASRMISTYSVVLEPGAIPGVGHTFELPADRVEFGSGVHGELGVKRVELSPVNSLIDQLLQQLLHSAAKKLNQLIVTHPQYEESLTSLCSSLQPLPVAVLVNNLGGCSQFEINCICNEVLLQMNQSVDNQIELGDSRRILLKVLWIRSGCFMTSFDAHGVSVSVFPLADREWLDWLQSSEKTAAAVGAELGGSLNEDPIRAEPVGEESKSKYEDELIEFEDDFLAALRAGCQQMIANEQLLNQLDAGTGDCDCGSTMAKMGRLLLQRLQQNRIKASFEQIAEEIGTGGVGGTSGAIYSLLCAGASAAVLEWRKSKGKVEYEQRNQFWALLVENAIRTVREYGRADLGDRTMLDALWSLPKELRTNDIDCEEKRSQLVSKIRQAAEQTAALEAKAGRAFYAKSRSFGVPDPGAWAAYLLVEAFLLHSANSLL